jgi:hypothetical protein
MVGECKDCKRVREHVASLLPFRVLEAAAGKPLRISGVAISAGVSRNFNVYAPEELQAFASELVNSPMYIEHVAVPNAVGKVTKAYYDSVSRCLRYEAEVYDQALADKIRNGLIQHVSVGADYDTLDTVNANVPHGLHNAELSLVAVPGIPEANIQILERLRESLASKGHGKLKLSVKELLEPLTCVFCGQPGTFLVSTCTSCGDKAAAGQVLNALSEQLDAQVAGEYFLGFYQDPSLFLSEHFRMVWLDQANGVLAVMAKTRVDPALERCQAILFLKSKWQPNTVADWLSIHPDYSIPASGSAGQIVQSGVEKLEEKELKKIVKDAVAEALKVREQSDVEKQAQVDRSQQYGIGIKQGGNVTKPSEFASIPDDQFADPVNYRYPVDKEHCKPALGYFDQPDNRSQYSSEEQAKILQKIVVACLANGVEVTYQANDSAYKALPEELKAKCQGYTKESTDAEKLAVAETKLRATEKVVEDLKKLVPGVDLLANPPKMMAVSEHVTVLEGLLPPAMVERSSMGMQRQGQAVRSAILKAQEKLKAK